MTVTDTLPAGVTFDSATSSQGSCSRVERHRHLRARHARRRRPARPSRSRSGARRRARSPTRRRSPRRPATRAPPTTPRAPTTTVDPAADLSLTKSDAPDPVLAGQLLTYTLTVAQRGPSSATGVTVTDTLPAGVTFDSATSSQGSCSRVQRHRHLRARHARRRGERDRHDQDPAALRRARSRTRRRSPPPSATRTRPTTPRAPTTTVDPAADLSLTKSDCTRPGACWAASDLHPHRPERRPLERHRRDRHRHPARRRDLRLGDALAGQLLASRAAPSRCTLGTLADAGSATVTIKIRRSTPGTITNQATVSVDYQRPELRQQLRERHDHRRSGRRPVAHEVRLARPRAGRRADHLHAHGPERRSLERHRRDRHRHLAGRRDVRLRHVLAGQLLRVERHGQLLAGHARRSRRARPSRSRSAAPRRARSRTRRRSSPPSATRTRQTTRRAPGRLSRPSPSDTHDRVAQRRWPYPWSLPMPSARRPTARTGPRWIPRRATRPSSGRAS